MKKSFSTLLMVALFCILILASCNIDPNIGILSEISQAEPNSGVVLRSYLGATGIGDAESCYYYLADDGVYSYKSRTATSILVSDSIQRVVGAFLESDTDLYVLVENKKEMTTTLKYSTNAGSTFSDIGTGFRGLLENGFCWNDTNVYYLTAGGATPINTEGCDSIEVLTSLATESNTGVQYAFFTLNETTGSETTRRHYVIKYGQAGPLFHVDSSDTEYYCGFQYMGNESTFILFHKNSSTNVSSAWKISDGEIVSFVTNLNNSLEKAKSPNASFYNDKNDTVIVKCANYFASINASGEVESINRGFATDICTSDITNIKLISGRKYIVGTVNSLIYSIDMDDSNNPPTKL